MAYVPYAIDYGIRVGGLAGQAIITNLSQIANACPSLLLFRLSAFFPRSASHTHSIYPSYMRWVPML